MAPVLEKALGVECIVYRELDTDQLGTFSGEIERQDDPLSTARLKCQLAMERSGFDLAVASEGSFGAHPSIPFVAADDELVLLLDTENNLEVVGREISTATNFAGQYVENFSALCTFAERVQFPSHALILKNREKNFDRVIKGINSWLSLEEAYKYLLAETPRIFAETDMRAMYNPSRMKVIEKATENLAADLLSTCERCGQPGFAVKDVIRGLPCRWCGSPTRSVKTLIYRCEKCGFENLVANPEQSKEDPMYCDVCNP